MAHAAAAARSRSWDGRARSQPADARPSVGGATPSSRAAAAELGTSGRRRPFCGCDGACKPPEELRAGASGTPAIDGLTARWLAAHAAGHGPRFHRAAALLAAGGRPRCAAAHVGEAPRARRPAGIAAAALRKGEDRPSARAGAAATAPCVSLGTIAAARHACRCLTSWDAGWLCSSQPLPSRY